MKVLNTKPEKKSVGRPKQGESVKREKLFEKYKNKFMNNGKLVSSSSEIYVAMSKLLKLKDSQTVYLHARRYFEQNRPSKNYKFDEELLLYENSGDYDQTYTLDVRDDDLISGFKETKPYIRGLRSYLRVIIWELTKYTCDWHFSTLDLRQNQVICNGFCKETNCKAKVFVNTENNRSVLRVTVKGYSDDVDHAKKSYTTDAHKTRIQNLLEKNTPYVTRSLLAADMIKLGDDDSSLIPTRDTLKKQKYRMNILERGPYLDDDPVIALVKMKGKPDVCNTIHTVCITPFHILYSTPTQTALLKTEKRRKRIILSMDATGVSLKLSSLTSVSNRTGGPKRCFLYIITLQSNDFSLPIYQMLSQDHSSLQISMMLDRCRTLNNYFNPNEVIMDQSAAFMLANVISFTRFKSIHEYLSFCFDIMRDTDQQSIAKHSNQCYIRIDRSHTVKTIMRNTKLVKRANPIAIQFYRRLLGFLIQEKNVDICEQTITTMFTIMHSSYLINSNIIAMVKRLEQVAREHKIDRNPFNCAIEESNDVIDQNPPAETSDAKNKFNGWILGLASDAVKDVQNDSNDDTSCDVNPYYAPSIQASIIEILSLLPLYGNIMNIPMGSTNEVPTSSSTETDFDVLKNDLFQGSKGIRVDTFVEKHLKFTQGRLVGKRAKEVRKEIFDSQSNDSTFQNSEIDGSKCDSSEDEHSSSVNKPRDSTSLNASHDHLMDGKSSIVRKRTDGESATASTSVSAKMRCTSTNARKGTARAKEVRTEIFDNHLDDCRSKCNSSEDEPDKPCDSTSLNGWQESNCKSEQTFTAPPM